MRSDIRVATWAEREPERFIGRRRDDGDRRGGDRRRGERRQGDRRSAARAGLHLGTADGNGARP